MVTGPTVGVLALQGDVREHLTALTACGARARPVRRPDDVTGLHGIVLPGGESTTIAKLARLTGLRDPLVAALAGGLPAYGSCAGMILLADRVLDGIGQERSFGGLDILVRRNAFGRQVQSFEAELPMTGIPGGPVHAAFIRAPWVEEVGPAVTVLAHVTPPGTSTSRIVAVHSGSHMATAFHPEITGDLRVHRLFLRLIDGSRNPPAVGRGRGRAEARQRRSAGPRPEQGGAADPIASARKGRPARVNPSSSQW